MINTNESITGGAGPLHHWFHLDLGETLFLHRDFHMSALNHNDRDSIFIQNNKSLENELYMRFAAYQSFYCSEHSRIGFCYHQSLITHDYTFLRNDGNRQCCRFSFSFTLLRSTGGVNRGELWEA